MTELLQAEVHEHNNHLKSWWAVAMVTTLSIIGLSFSETDRWWMDIWAGSITTTRGHCCSHTSRKLQTVLFLKRLIHNLNFILQTLGWILTYFSDLICEPCSTTDWSLIHHLSFFLETFRKIIWNFLIIKSKFLTKFVFNFLVNREKIGLFMFHS